MTATIVDLQMEEIRNLQLDQSDLIDLKDTL